MIQILASSLISIILIVGALNTPANLYSMRQWYAKTFPTFGGAFTSLVSTNNLSDFPTTYNNNLNLAANITATNTFSALNTFLSASSSLGSCDGPCYFGATATSSFSRAGVLTLIDALAVGSGGTASTTISSNRVILGNGASGFKTVNGFGASGQYLVSNGVDTAPSWQTSALSLSDNYTWTGVHKFNNGFTTASTTWFDATTTFAGGVTIDGNTAATGTVIALGGDGQPYFQLFPVMVAEPSSTTQSYSGASGAPGSPVATVCAAGGGSTGNPLTVHKVFVPGKVRVAADMLAAGGGTLQMNVNWVPNIKSSATTTLAQLSTTLTSTTTQTADVELPGPGLLVFCAGRLVSNTNVWGQTKVLFSMVATSTYSFTATSTNLTN